MNKLYRVFLVISLLLLLTVMTMVVTGATQYFGPALTAFFVSLAIGLRGVEPLKGFAYTVGIFAAVTAAMFYPDTFRSVGDFDLKRLIVPLLQIIMFGMGTAMSLKDFAAVAKQPKAVFIGIGCQFTIMPLVGVSLATLANFPPEIAAGVVLVGSSPSGLASNVMSYLAKANLALSVTLTAVATLLAPLMTPLLMKWLAGQFIPIAFWAMMWSIIKIVIIPIIAGLIFNHLAHGRAKWLDVAMPRVSMISIGIIIAIITAAGRDSLITIGIALIIVCLIHNMLGYGLGYSFSKLLGCDKKSCRTIAFEVGMQNGGLASGIALEMGKVATVGLAPAVFGPMMNITGSSLATWWRGKDEKLENSDGAIPE